MEATLGREATATESRAASALGGKYLTFSLGNEEYGLPVMKVREIIKVMDITQVPQVAEHVLGVINLRGKVIPVIDLRRKFGFPAQAYTERTCIIVAEVGLAAGKVLMGVVVDAVSDVLNVSGSEIDETPHFGGHHTIDYLLGLAKVRGTVKILLDLDRVLLTDGVLQMQAV